MSLNLKKYGRVALAALGHLYDLYRFYKYGGWRKNYKNKDQRNYSLVKAYHGLEKNISFIDRQPGRGAATLENIKSMLGQAKSAQNYGVHDYLAYKVVHDYAKLEGVPPESLLPVMDESFSARLKEYDRVGVGAFPVSSLNLDFFKDGTPDQFFLSRYTVRNFSDKPVPAAVINKAISLAHKTPSACNRQPWHIYHLGSKDLIEKALKIHNGNSGFGQRVRSLLVICIEDQAFISGNERYQHWIDGGMYSMSLVYAFHALGVSSCCLNWSQMPKGDLQFRREIGISAKHTIIMLLAIGYAEEGALVCHSPRRPINEVMTVLR